MRAPSRVFPVLRLALVGLWVVWAAAAWWVAPRAATFERAEADAAADRVVSYQWADSFGDANGSLLWFTAVPFTYSGDAAPQVFIWRTGFGRVHYAQVPAGDPRSGYSLDGVPTEPGQLQPIQPGSDFSVVSPPTRSDDLARLLPTDRQGNPVPYFPPVLATILALLCLAILIQGPAPKLGTRWFWFFLGGLPFGLGMLLWLRVERPWAEPVSPAPDKKTGQPKRYSGLTGLGLMFLTGIVISILVALLRSLPEWLVPSALP
ncbi:hypothetical protein Ais01nite_40000 [Asanoa ishikariensis]|nr:hypothetical protein Ais01nite_40000 [Asanoa ishikariensis]